MVNLRCHDYGYECKYETEGDIDRVIDDYRNHMNDIHGIDYSRESVKLFVERKNKR